MAKFFCGVLLTLLLIAHARADVTLVRQYRMGEFDGVSSGTVATSSTAPGSPLTIRGSALYSDDTPNDDSSLSIDFDGSTGYGLSGNPGAMTNNFGVDLWVKPAAIDGSEHIILYAGDIASNGWGIIQNPDTGQFSALFGGQVIFGQGDVSTGQWTHLAFVCTDSNATFYVNGVPSGPCVDQLPSPPVTSAPIAIAASFDGTPSYFFQGKIDEVRIFTFASGAFLPADLNYTPTRQPAIQIARCGTNTVLSWPTAHFAFVLESSTDLTTNNWAPFFRPPHTNGNFVVTDTASDASRFYHLRTFNGPSGPPLSIPGKYVRMTQGDDQQTSDVTDINDKNAGEVNAIDMADPAALDASDAFYDPFDPNGVGVPLIYHWIIVYPAGPVTSPFGDAGITGYRKAFLQLEASSMIAQIAPAVEFRLQVASNYSSSLTQNSIYSQNSESALSLSVFNACKGQTVACPTCTCKEAAALPPTDSE